ncbi:unnamed protein product [Calypogeia fissa]
MPSVRSYEDSDSSSPKAEDDEHADSTIEKFEQRTKASIDKLKYLLCSVKTRPGDSSLYSIMKLGEDELLDREISRTLSHPQQLGDMGAGDMTEEELPFAEPLIQQDGLTSTTTTVTLDKHSKKAIVTMVASVRDQGDESSQEPIERSVILAARALARSAAALEEKANALTLSSKLKQSSFEDRTDTTAPEHERLVAELEKSKIIDGAQVRKGYYAGTPFRPVYEVKLEQPDGSITEALLKPATPGDVHCRWGNASSDWVAYQVGRLLGTDMVPPAAMRYDVKIGEKTFPLATLLHIVPQVKPLTRLSLQEWGGELPTVFVSNAHILDALLGSCPRARNMFMEGPSWSQAGARQAMLLDHPMGPGQGKLHPMWTQRGQISGIKYVSGSTLSRLRTINKSSLTGALGRWVSSTEIDHILERLEQVLAYFDSMAQHGSRSLTVV